MNGNLVTLIMYIFHQMMEFMGAFPTLFIFKSCKPHTNFLTPALPLLQSDQEQVKQDKEEFVISLNLLKIFLWFKVSTATITTMKVVLK